MPKINTYGKDSGINSDDILLGSDGDTNNKKTKNYRVGDLLDWFSKNRKAEGIAYKYGVDSQYNRRGYFFSDTDIVKEVTKLYINAFSATGDNYTVAFNTFIGQELYIKIVDIDDPAKYGYFVIEQISKQPENAYFELDVSLIGDLGYGKLVDGYNYFFVFEPLQVGPPGPQVTKTSELENDGADGINPFITLSDVFQGNKLISYGFYNVENYDYFVWADKYIINNVVYDQYVSDTVTLNDGDDTYDRIDVIVLNEDGTISVIEGTPSNDPVKPTVDSETQLEVTFVIVTANSTSPSEVETYLMYDEDLQESNEWNTEGVVSRVITNSTEQAFSGTKSIKFNTSVFNDRLRLSSTTGFVKTDVDVFVFAIKTSSEPILQIYFEPSENSSTIDRGVPIYITDGNYGYDKNVTDWQVIVIPIQDFNLSNGTYKGLQFTNKLNFGTSTFFIDKVFLQKHGGNGGNTGDFLISTNNLNDVENADTARENIKAQIKSGSYGTIALMLADQAVQKDKQRIKVTDASADANITFADGETKLHAYYEFNGTATGSINDYTLISAPYGNHTGGGDYLYNVLDYGAKGDGIQLLDGAITASDATFTSATASFVAGDVGKVIHIQGAGASGAYHTTTIASINSSTSVELTSVAVTTVSAKTFVYGTENTSFIQDAINACFNGGGGTVFIPQGIYILNGSLQNNVGDSLIDYNSQLFIPYIADGTVLTENTNAKTIIHILGEVAPMPVQGSGLNAYPLRQNLKSSILLSTIQGSGTKPSVISSRGTGGSFPTDFNWIATKIENLEILVTPNSANKITIGGLNFYESITSFFEHVTVFPYNINLYDIENPDVIDVDGISYAKNNCSKGNYVKTCLVAGFTNGFRVGEHGEFYGAFASVCYNGYLQEFSYHTSNYYRVKADWCVNAFKINDDCAIHVVNFDGEYRVNGDWYDSVYHILDPLNKATGLFYYNIIEASVGLNNSLFLINGAKKLRCRAISFSDESEITVTGTTTEYKLEKLLRVLKKQGLIFYTADIISEYLFENNLIDSISGFNGTGTDITYVTGVDGKGANFNGTTSFIDLGDKDEFSFTDGINDTPFSFSFDLKFDTVAPCFIIQKRDGGAFEYQIQYSGTEFSITLYDNGVASSFIQKSYTVTPSASTWYKLVFTYDGSGVDAGLNMYIDTISVGTSSTTGTYTKMSNTNKPLILGYRQSTSSMFLDGVMDNLKIYNKELTQLEVDAL